MPRVDVAIPLVYEQINGLDAVDKFYAIHVIANGLWKLYFPIFFRYINE